MNREDTITIELDECDVTVLANAILEQIKALTEKPTLQSMCKSLVLRGITEKLVAAVMAKDDVQGVQGDILLQALKKEREAKDA